MMNLSDVQKRQKRPQTHETAVYLRFIVCSGQAASKNGRF